MVSDYYEALMILAVGIVVAGLTFLWFLRLSPAMRRRRRRRGRRDGSLRVDLFQPPAPEKDRAET